MDDLNEFPILGMAGFPSAKQKPKPVSSVGLSLIPGGQAGSPDFGGLVLGCIDAES